jgi:hypothetical protein
LPRDFREGEDDTATESINEDETKKDANDSPGPYGDAHVHDPDGEGGNELDGSDTDDDKTLRDAVRESRDISKQNPADRGPERNQERIQQGPLRDN